MTDLATPDQANDSDALTPLPAAARRCVSVAALLGLAVLGESVVHWNSPDLIKYGAFVAVALFFSVVRVSAPGIAAPVSLSFLFVLFGLVELTAPETVLLAILAAVAHGYWNQRRRVRSAQVLFQASLAAIAVAAAEQVYKLPWFDTISLSTISSSTFSFNTEWFDSLGLDPSLQLALRLAAATLVLFLVQSGPMSAVTAWIEGTEFIPVWWSISFRALACYLSGAVLAQGMSVAGRYVGWPTVLLTGPVVYLIFLFYRLYVHRMEDQTKHALEVASLHLRTIEALALAIEAKDTTTHDHLRRVQIYAAEMGKELGLTEDEQQALLAASMLHDIGKLAVPEHIISKPGRLTPEEFEKMKIHPTVGAEILERVRFPYPVVPIVRAHHEKWDGTGYPAGLRGEAIPIGARILAAVDCLDALASDRQYRRALPLDEAMKVVVADVGKAFDPRVVDTLSRHYVKWEKMANIPAPNSSKLSTEVKVERGAAPAAGFESTKKEPVTSTKDQPMDFLTSIAAARQEVQALFEISQDLGNSLSLDETLSVLNVRLRKIIPHHSVAIWLRRGELLIPEYVNGEDYRLFSSLEIPVGQGLSGWVAETGKPIVNGNPSVEPGYLNDPTRTSTLRSAVAVPLEGASGILGVVALYHMERDAFSKDHLRILMAISPKIGMSIENALKFRQVESSATTDFLTSLPNARSLFVQLDAELARGKRTEQPLTVIVLDLDGLKAVNDRFGHLEGNKVLKAVAAGLKPMCREYDYVARMGGDEFVVLLPGMDPADANRRIEELRDVIR
ncbi:MAG: HD domain-containing phosphohydrolase, partial [Bryobacteraceae bacterium]